jgi:hypothetical protein
MVKSLARLLPGDEPHPAWTFLRFQEFDHLLCYPLRGGRILTGDKISVSNAIRFPRLYRMEYGTLFGQGGFQFERHIVFCVILFFFIRERRNVFTLKKGMNRGIYSIHPACLQTG